MKILGIIPARGGSKSIPKKNLRLLNGKPLISYTIVPALNSKLDKVVVSTESQDIANISKRYEVEVVMRPKNLSLDSTPTLPVLQDVISKLNEKFDAVMTLQPTSPLRTLSDINNSIRLFNSDGSANSLVSVVRLSHQYHPQKLMKLDGKYLKEGTELIRRQETENFYARNGAAIYMTKIKNLDEYIIGGKILPYLMSKIKSIDIDDLEDWELVEKILKYSIK